MLSEVRKQRRDTLLIDESTIGFSCGHAHMNESANIVIASARKRKTILSVLAVSRFKKVSFKL